ncbi:MAG: hypothetical protein B7Y88_14240 [Sphingomonadales bacterium 32-64-17]|nr:MAG: hypothetical protein B7Y88_14240 [Sphingomonadales bacterium 32-64-17]
MPDLVWLIYLVLFLAIMPTATCARQSTYHRVKFGALGLAVMFFGTGRLLYWAKPENLASFDWIFTLAHLAFVTFVVLSVYAANHYRKHGVRL